MENEKKSGENFNSIIELIDHLREKGIPPDRYKKYVDRYLEFKARNECIPLNGNFELTPLCNLDCRMCYVHLPSAQFDSEKLLSVDAWKRIMGEAREAGMWKATLTGGECLTYPGFDELYLFLYRQGIIPSILSNGLLMDSKRIDFFKKYPPRTIQVTLYGSNDDVYEKVTGHRVFHRIYENLIKIRDAGLSLRVSITPSAYMKDDRMRLLEKAEELRVPYVINSLLKPPRQNTGRSAEDISAEEYIEMYRFWNQSRDIQFDAIDPSELPDEGHAGVEQKGLRCGAGRSTFAITYEGNICPCFSLSEISASVLENDFLSAWRQINSRVNNYPIPRECIGCVYYSSCITCPGAHKGSSEIGHCDRRICERTKKFISAGIFPFPKGLEE